MNRDKIILDGIISDLQLLVSDVVEIIRHM